MKSIISYKNKPASWTLRFPLWLILPLVFLAIWQFLVSSGWWPETLIASPLRVFNDFVKLALSGELLSHARVSLIRLAGGFGFGTVTAIILGSLVGLSKVVERMLSPILQALLPIPPTAWIPLLIIAVGIGEASKIVLIAIGVFGVVYFSTVQGIRGADQKLVEVATVMQKSPLDLAVYVLLPSALPVILTGMRMALGLSWILLIAAEMIAARMVSPVSRVGGLGLGWLIYDARNFSRSDDMIVGMIAIGLLGKLSDMGMARLQGLLLVWRQSFRGV